MVENKPFLIFSHTGSDYLQLIKLTETTYQGREISKADFLEWEYALNPYGKALITVSEIKQEIVSQYAVLPRAFSIGKKIFQGSLSVNSITHPDYRGNGLFKKLAEETFIRCKENEINFTIGFPNHFSHPVIVKNEIFESIGFLPLLIYPINPVITFFKYISSKRRKKGDEIVLNGIEEALKKISGISLFNFEVDATNYENFLHRFNESKINVTNRSLSFIKWRYLNIPFRKYHLLKIVVGDQIEAMVILRAKYIYDMRCLILVDFISIDNVRIGKCLEEILKNISLVNNLDLVFTTIPKNTGEYTLLKKLGFYSIPRFLMPQKLVCIVRKHLPTCPDQVKDFKKWFFTFGDYDIF